MIPRIGNGQKKPRASNEPQINCPTFGPNRKPNPTYLGFYEMWCQIHVDADGKWNKVYYSKADLPKYTEWWEKNCPEQKAEEERLTGKPHGHNNPLDVGPPPQVPPKASQASQGQAAASQGQPDGNGSQAQSQQHKKSSKKFTDDTFKKLIQYFAHSLYPSLQPQDMQEGEDDRHYPGNTDAVREVSNAFSDAFNAFWDASRQTKDQQVVAELKAIADIIDDFLFHNKGWAGDPAVICGHFEQLIAFLQESQEYVARKIVQEREAYAAQAGTSRTGTQAAGGTLSRHASQANLDVDRGEGSR